MAKHYEAHPYNCTRMFTDDQNARMLQDIRDWGQTAPIILYDGMIVDGKNRYNVMMSEGMEPYFEELELEPGKSLPAWIADRSRSQHFREKITENEVCLLAATAERKSVGNSTKQSSLPTLDEVCEALGILDKRDKVKEVITLIRCGVDDLDRKIADGYSIATAMSIYKKFKSDLRLLRKWFDKPAGQAAKELKAIKDQEQAEKLRKAAEKARLELAQLGAGTLKKEPEGNSDSGGGTEDAGEVAATASTTTTVSKSAESETKVAPEAKSPNAADAPADKQRLLSGFVAETETIEMTEEEKKAKILELYASLSRASRESVRVSQKEIDENAIDLDAYNPRDVKMMAKLDCKEFKELWVEWCDYMESKGKPLSQSDAEVQVDTLKRKSTLAVVFDIIQHTIDQEKTELIYKPPRRKSASSFVHPTKKQIEEYIKSRGLDVDAGKFYGHYCANGWLIGKNPMVNWKAAVRNWGGEAFGKGKKLRSDISVTEEYGKDMVNGL